MDLLRSPLITAVPGDFSARLTLDGLELPATIVDALQPLNVRTVESLVSLLQAAPSAVAHVLGWEVEQVQDAWQDLRGRLHGVLIELVLNPPRAGARFGARRPVD